MIHANLKRNTYLFNICFKFDMFFIFHLPNLTKLKTQFPKVQGFGLLYAESSI